MFERFTKAARAAVERAAEDAAALGAERVGPEHLLLGVAATDGHVLEDLGLGYPVLRAELERTGGGLDADALAAIGIDLGEVERRVEASFGAGALRGRGGRTRFAPKAKKALELSLREALALGDRGIGGEHVLLGVLRDPGERVRRLLERHGQSPETVRAAVLAARAPTA
jgi:ATP-dependent Clp protease ATP-binding subunit ClpA